MPASRVQTNLIEGYVTKGAKQPLEHYTYETPAVGPHDIYVEITHCGICHSDLHLINNDWHISQFPLVPGHEIIGIVRQKGEHVHHLKEGQRVGIGWQRSSCGKCTTCHRGQENSCRDQQATCVGHYGGFATAIVADGRFAFPIPDSLDSVNAAPLLCGGATVFSPLLTYNVNATTRVGVIGVGGLGHLAIQFASKMGCEVTAFSTSPSKEAEAKKLGAEHFVLASDPAGMAKAADSLDLILFAGSGVIPWEVYLDVLRPYGRLVLLGIPADKIELPLFPLIAGRKGVCGSNIGSPLEIQEMLAFAARHNVVAQTELFDLADVNQALEKLAANQVHYRVVLKCER